MAKAPAETKVKLRSVKEIAAEADLPASIFYHWSERKGRTSPVSIYRIEGRVFFDLDEVQEYVKSCRISPTREVRK